MGSKELNLVIRAKTLDDCFLDPISMCCAWSDRRFALSQTRQVLIFYSSSSVSTTAIPSSSRALGSGSAGHLVMSSDAF